MALEFIKITCADLEALSRGKTLFLFPVAPLEDHGPHLPLGMDYIEAKKLSQALAEKLEKDLPEWTMVLMPAAPLGIDSNTTAFALTVRPHVLRDWLVDGCQALRRLGFQHFACVSGHLGPRQLTAIEEASKLIRRKNGFGLFGKAQLLSLSSVLITAKDVRRSPLWPDPQEHGGARDTAVGMLLCPESVKPIAKSLPEIERPPTYFGRTWLRMRKRLQGYWGTPSAAQIDLARMELSRELEVIFNKLKLHLTVGSGPSTFRSWYSILPPNRSFFKSWILALMILVLIGFWTSIWMQGYS